MARTILDDDLRSWEAFASTGPFGYALRSRVVFNCTTDPAVRPRMWALDGDKSDAETLVATAPAAALVGLLEKAEPLP
ncbi:MAG: hypothetical protein EXR95_11285 [Gemmatimonadetes bacterium]|nr:hypothetical protein [Gemmatimonadota bacterium]